MTDKRWLSHYDASVPHTLRPYPQLTLVDVLADSAERRPRGTAVRFMGATITYAELERWSTSLGMALTEQEVRSGDRVAIIMPNAPQFLIAQFGAWKAGAIVAPLNPLYVEEELIHSLNEVGAETAFVLSAYYRKVKRLQPQTHLKRLVVTNIKEYLPWYKGLLFSVLRERQEGHRVKLEAGDVWLQSLMSESPPVRTTRARISPADPAMLMFTGGTTGRPKAALSSHHALYVSGLQISTWLESVRTDWQDAALLLMPLFHTYGNIGTLSASLVGHMRMIAIADPRDIDGLVQTIRSERPAFLCAVPTLFTALLNHPDVVARRVDLRSIKLCLCGAAPLMVETKRRFEALTGGRIVEGYALTESVMAAVVSPVQGQYRPGSVGLPLPDVEIRIVDAHNEERSLPTGEIGEIAMSAPQLMRGYWQRPDETAEILRDGWLYTGDLGYMDADGYLFIVDRQKDLIKPSGFQVWPREVEEVIASHPAVMEVGVAGVPDQYQGEAVVAWVVAQPGATISGDEIRAYCREHLAAYKVPRRIEFRDQLPKSAVGKVLRRKLATSDEPPEPVLEL